MRKALFVTGMVLAAAALVPTRALAQAASASADSTDQSVSHRIRPAVAVGFGYQPQATLDQRRTDIATEVGGAFTYNIAADVDVLPQIRVGVQLTHTPWEMLHSVSTPADYPVDRGRMTLVSASAAGRLLLGTAVPLWLQLGAGGFHLSQDAYEVGDNPADFQPAVSTFDPALIMAAYFDFRTRWSEVMVRGGADDTYVFFGEESGFERSHLIAFRLALAYRF